MTVNENYKLKCSSQTRLCLQKDIKPVTKLKKIFKKQSIQQINKTKNLNVTVNNENKSGMKQKIESKVNQVDITRLNKLQKLLDNSDRKKKRTEFYTTTEISKEDFTTQLLEMSDETYKTSVKLKKAIHSDNKIKLLYKENQNEITRVNESENRLEGIEEEE